MIILVLIAVQYFQNFVFSFEKVSNVQNHSSSDSKLLIKKPPPLIPYHYLENPVFYNNTWQKQFLLRLKPVSYANLPTRNHVFWRCQNYPSSCPFHHYQPQNQCIPLQTPQIPHRVTQSAHLWKPCCYLFMWHYHNFAHFSMIGQSSNEIPIYRLHTQFYNACDDTVQNTLVNTVRHLSLWPKMIFYMY